MWDSLSGRERLQDQEAHLAARPWGGARSFGELPLAILAEHALAGRRKRDRARSDRATRPRVMDGHGRTTQAQFVTDSELDHLAGGRRRSCDLNKSPETLAAGPL